MAKVLTRCLAWLLFDLRVSGRENLRSSRAILAGVPHRNWVEPVLLLSLLPMRSRLAIVADGPTALGSRWRRAVSRLVGGVIPVWPKSGVTGLKPIVSAADDTLKSGAVVVIYPETGSPSTPPQLRALSGGLAHLAAHSQAPVVPIVFGGTHELFLRRRIEVLILPPLPPPTSRSRRDVAVFMREFTETTQAAAVEAHRAAESAGPRRKLGRWLTGRYPRAE